MLSFQAPQGWGAAERSEAEGLFYRFKAHRRLTAQKYMCLKALPEKAWPSSIGGLRDSGGREHVETVFISVDKNPSAY
jgi:hypothetical protein